MRAGRTFVTNGPLIDFTVDGQNPGATLEKQDSGRVRVRARVLSRLPFEKVEVVQDGEVVAEQPSVQGRQALLEREIDVKRGGWLAARVHSNARSRGGARVFGHTSPIYVRVTGTPFRKAEAAGRFIDEIEDSLLFVRKKYKFASEADRAVALGRFHNALEVYHKVARQEA